MKATATAMHQGANGQSGGRLVSADGRTLPLVGARLETRARGGLARTVLAQRFKNPFPEPLRVTYLLPLPHDGAVSGFTFTVAGQRVVGEIDRRDAARTRFEEALAAGRTAALVDQERGSVFTQEVGNIPAGAELVAELVVDQRLTWLPTGAWEWRFPSTVAPRHQGGPGRVADAGRLQVDVADAPLPPRLTLALSVEDALAEGRAAESPSHPVAFRAGAARGGFEASFVAEHGVPLDRDVVVRWPVASPTVGLSLDTFRPERGALAGRAFGLLTIVPPAREARAAAFARDLVVLLDTSGSMEGEPLAHARRVVSALVDGLRDDDTLELIEFSDAPRRWHRRPAKATASAREDALRWLASLRASGSTEMKDAIVEALAGLRDDAQRQILLVTDGQIGFEDEIVGELARNLPAGSRLHTLGVGESVNRSLLGPAARAGRGTESIVGLGEDAERAVATLVARMEAPLVTEVALTGDALVAHAPAKLPDLYAGAPALVALELRPEGGTLRVSGRVPGGRFDRSVSVPPLGAGAGNAAVAARFGREAVEDLEVRLAAGAPCDEIDPLIERIGLAHQLSTRLTSWIAVSEEATVDPTRPTRRVAVPHELPHGVSVEGLGLRRAAPSALAGAAAPACPSAVATVPAGGRRVPIAKAMLPTRGDPRAPGAPGERSRQISGKMERAAPPTFDEAELAPEAAKEAPAPRTLAARLVLDDGGELVLEVDVDAELEWDPPEELTLLLADGTGRVARVVEDRTTGAATLAAGTTLRLTLRVGEPALGAAVARIVGESGAGPISIVVAARPPRGRR